MVAGSQGKVMAWICKSLRSCEAAAGMVWMLCLCSWRMEGL